MLKRLREPQNPHVVLVKGHPGMGKTTLVKKIAYDWASHEGNHSDQFSLVLAIPLRYVGPTTNFLLLTADYYSDRLHLSPSGTIRLLNWLNELGRELLICLDGLDEYNCLAQSPFKQIFAAPFERLRPPSVRFPPPSFPYQLLITSRPYACDLVHQDFILLRFEISPLDKNNLTKFVRLYCETDKGLREVIEYLAINADLIIQIPLILTCFVFWLI